MKLWQLEEQLQQVKPFSEAKTQLEQVKSPYSIILMSSTPQRHIWLHT
jgi:predicted RNA methylase